MCAQSMIRRPRLYVCALNLSWHWLNAITCAKRLTQQAPKAQANRIVSVRSQEKKIHWETESIYCDENVTNVLKENDARAFA